MIGRVNGRNEGFQQEENAEDHGRGNQEGSVPARAKAKAAHARKEIVETGGTVEKASEENACEAGTYKHCGEHQDASQFWERLASEKMRSGD
jgi:hypothetical protein